MTTIDEARNLKAADAAEAREFLLKYAAVCDQHGWDHRSKAIRTLLSSYDEMKGRIEEAVSLMEPFAREAALVSDTIPDVVGIVEDVWPSLTFGDLRAISSFVSREKVDGGARG